MLVLMAIPARVACEILMNLFNITRSLPDQTNEEAAQQCSRWSIVTVRLISTVYCLHFAERGCRPNILFLHVRFVENLHLIPWFTNSPLLALSLINIVVILKMPFDLVTLLSLYANFHIVTECVL